MQDIRYNYYTTAQFLDDPSFIEWVKYKTPASELFWNSWIQSNPVNLDAFREAEMELRTILSAPQIPIENTAREEVWERIQTNIGSVVTTIKTVSKFRRIATIHIRWWAAAAILAVCVTSYFLSIPVRAKNSSVGGNSLSNDKNDPLPGVNTATITLANGKVISLAELQSGTSTQEGNVAIKKLQDGTIAYTTGAKEAVASPSYNTLIVPRGANIVTLRLADGTQVWLNAESSLKYPTAFSGNERKVEISGEAYFEVAHNASAPFSVTVNQGAPNWQLIEVLGTHFNVNGYAEEGAVSTTLLEGSVNIFKNGHKATLRPGQQANVSEAGTIQLNENADIEKIMAWKNGFFSFANENLQSLMQKLSRWYDIDVAYSGEIPPIKFSGEIDRSLSLTQLLTAINMVGVRYSLSGRRLLITN